MNESKLSMKWYYFFTYLIMPISIISSIIALFRLNEYYNMIEYYSTVESEIEMAKNFILLFETINFWVLVGAIALVILLICMSKSAIKLLDFYLFFTIAFGTFSSINTYTNYDVKFWIFYIITFCALSLCWFYPNHIYFKKREKLFNGEFRGFNLKNNKYNELIKLKELLDKNIITKKEFEKEKKRILDSFDHETEKISEKNIEQYEENGLVPKNRE